MSFFDFGFYISLLIVIIECYNEVRLNNFGNFFDRVFYFFNVRNIFNILSFSTMISFFIIFFFENNETNIIKKINDINFNTLNFYPPIVFTLLVILFRFEKLKDSFGYYYDSKFSFLVNLKYIFYRIISFFATFYIFKFIFFFYSYVNNILIKNKFYFNDWLIIEELDQALLFKKGVYISIFIAVCFFFFVNNGFLKINSSYNEEKRVKLEFLNYLFVSLILCFGVFLSLYSIFNAYYNVNNTSFKDFMSYDNVFGILPIRVASVIILYNFLIYFYENVLDKRFVIFTLVTLAPFNLFKRGKYGVHNYFNEIRISDRETLYFCQISFYIINLAVSEITYISNINSLYFGVLNFSILFIIDDFNIINAYSKGLYSTLKWHYFRIFATNCLMFFSSIAILYNNDLTVILFTYLAFSTMLSFIYFRNFDKILTGLK